MVKGVDAVKVNVNIDPNIKEDEIIISIKEMNTKVEKILSIITEEGANGVIPLQREERVYLVNPQEISHVFSEDNKCFAFRDKEKYRYKDTLKQFEERFRHNFMRISKYCVANISWMEYFEATFGGSLVVVFKNGEKEIVSRKYAKELKKALLKE
ncbi:LytTR family DNA-binding domain-containing protein [Siminovitchia terrae]|uniref:LytTR family DNA-binding domain-containing protein n=1 Tax=Siminovitchia terrae TaxID=1914933 RepID=UPI001BB39B45|nr:LytTR family DNA-binding domain-containing protein [Siminovitchia terrae]